MGASLGQDAQPAFAVPTVCPDDWIRIMTIALAAMLVTLFLLMQPGAPVQIQN
jgi:hypothetical protein